jgi:hypothetical protein
VSAPGAETPGLDEDQASVGARLAPARRLHSWNAAVTLPLLLSMQCATRAFRSNAAAGLSQRARRDEQTGARTALVTVVEPGCRARIQTVALPRVRRRPRALGAAIVESGPGRIGAAWSAVAASSGPGTPIASFHRADVLARCLCCPDEAAHRAHAEIMTSAVGRAVAWPPGALGRELASAAPGGHDTDRPPADAGSRGPAPQRLQARPRESYRRAAATDSGSIAASGKSRSSPQRMQTWS